MWDDTKADGVSTLPASEYNTMVTAIKNQGYTVIIYKDGSNYIAKAGTTGAVISTNTDFSTVCQAAGNWITGNGIIFIKDPGTDIVIASPITFANKEIFVTSDFARLDFSGLNNVVFHFQDTVQSGYTSGGISNFRVKGDVTKTSQIFAKFTGKRAIVDNLLATWPDRVYSFVLLNEGCYTSLLTNIQGRAVLPIELYGVADFPNATTIFNCEVGYENGPYCIKITGGFDIKIKDCYLEDCGTGIYATGASSLFIEGNYVNQVATCGINIGSCFNSAITGNFINPTTTGATGIIATGFYGPTIIGNTFYTGSNDVTFISTDTLVRAVINGNIFRLENAPTGCSSIKTTSASHNIAIVGNSFYGGSGVTGTAINCSDLYYSTIVGNTFYNWSTPINITTKIGVVIESNYGYKNENSGSSSGTGAQQTIAHGLGATPTNITFGNITNGANPYRSAASDATNIYVTAVNGKSYYWNARI